MKKLLFLIISLTAYISFSQADNKILKYKSIQDVNLRSSSTVNSNIVKVIKKDERVKVIDSVKNWYKVDDYIGNVGYISKYFLIKEILDQDSQIESNDVSPIQTLIIYALTLIIFVIFYFMFKQKKKLRRYLPIIEVENEVQKILKEKEQLSKDYKEGKNVYDDLLNTISIYNENLHNYDHGLYEPIFDFGTSEKFKEEISKIRVDQKFEIRQKRACYCNTAWEVNGSKREGTKKTNRHIRLTLRAFNGECDTLISKVKWNNINSYSERMKRSFRLINEINESMNIHISENYLKLKLKELNLTYEYNLKKHEEKEEEKKKRALIREEEKARRDFELAQKETEKEKKIYSKALEEAKKSLGILSGEQLEKLKQRINDLEQNLEEANKKSERALSMAQQTKRGHVYVVSNIGSFGENIYKIGMTRRLDPIDRVKELGDASVPFTFDLHAMIYTEDAPKLESLLHNKFSSFRVNKINNRKEYFNVTIEDIEKCISENFNGEFELIKEYEAKEYFESKMMEKEQKDKKIEKEKFPNDLFNN
ncbi:MAG: DUF4041 domain-containing protein [Flavobacteriaceae bacterium]